MFSFFTYFLLSALLLSASCRQPSMDTSKADRILREIEMETELENQLSRARRVPAGEVRACGRRLLLFVWSTCGEPCTPRTFNAKNFLKNLNLNLLFFRRGHGHCHSLLHNTVHSIIYKTSLLPRKVKTVVQQAISVVK